MTRADHCSIILGAVLCGQMSSRAKRRLREAVIDSNDRDLLERHLAQLSGVVSSKYKSLAASELLQAEQEGVHVIGIASEHYPRGLLALYDPPPILFARSNTTVESLRLNELNVIAIVGARDSTSYGERVALTLSQWCTELGFSVVSGLARGIDSAAHRGSLKPPIITGQCPDQCQQATRPLGIVGGGLLHVSPKASQALACEMLSEGGVLISEYGLNQPPQPHHFRERNRLIAALSNLTVLIEARERSGALMTVRLALECGREVAAVPGPITSPASFGCNRIIQEGAQSIYSRKTLVEALQVAFPNIACPQEQSPEPLSATKTSNRRSRTADTEDISCTVNSTANRHRTQNSSALDPMREDIVDTDALCVRVLSFLQSSLPTAIDEIAEHIGEDIAKLFPTLGELEARGLINKTDDGRFEAA